MIVIDASVAVAAITESGEARRLVGRDVLHAPHVVDFEVTNVLRRLVSGGRLSADVAAAALAGWLQASVERHPLGDLATRVWELRDNVSAYDASYVALAESLGCDLATGDQRLARAPGKRCRILLLPS